MFQVGKSNPLTGRCYVGTMKEWDDTADQPPRLGMKLEFAVLLAIHVYAVYGVIRRVIT